MSSPKLIIDLGSHSIVAIVAQPTDSGIMIKGHGIARSTGIDKGVIKNISKAAEAVKKAAFEAQQIANTNISEAYVSFSSNSLRSFRNKGVSNVPQRNIILEDIKKAIKGSLDTSEIPDDYSLIHMFPYNICVDNKERIEDPYAMNASRLMIHTNIITASNNDIADTKKVIEEAGLKTASLVVDSYASLLSTTTPEERERGVCVVDIGASTTTIAIYLPTGIEYCGFIPEGSNHITSDISHGLRLPENDAERLKIAAYDKTLEPQESYTLNISETEACQYPHESIDVIARARMEDMLGRIKAKLDESEILSRTKAGIVITGGGAKLRGFDELARSFFTDSVVRCKLPISLVNLPEEFQDYTFATAIGLLEYAAGNNIEYEYDSNGVILTKKDKTPSHTPQPKVVDENNIDQVDSEDISNLMTIKHTPPASSSSSDESLVEKTQKSFKKLKNLFF